MRGHCEIAALTRSERGSVVVRGDEAHVVKAHPVDAVVDTTGAGDLYAAGFLFGLSRGLDLATAAVSDPRRRRGDLATWARAGPPRPLARLVV